MDNKEHTADLSPETFNKDWPTPAEAMSQLKSNNKDKSSTQYSFIQQLESQSGKEAHISFLQPSVVTPLEETRDVSESQQLTPNQMESVNIPDPNPDIHVLSETLEEAMYLRMEIHPSLLTQLKPCTTKDDDNCLYNAICLCLGMKQYQQGILRDKTAQCIRKYAGHFSGLLKAADEVSLETLIDQCHSPFSTQGWGSEFHLLALAILLKRNIFVYTTFKDKKGQFYQRKNKPIIGLAEELSQGGDKVEQHMNFEPQLGIACHYPICLHFSGAHFTALVPKLPNAIYCVPPATNLPSIPDNGIQTCQPETPMPSKKMTQKARWLASKTPAELAEYKARQKAKRKERAAIPGVLEKRRGADRERYAADPEKKKKAASEHYATKPEVLQKQKESKKMKYANDPEVRKKKIEAAAQPEVLQKRKEYKKMKYATDPEVRKKKIEAATQPEVLQKQKEYKKMKYATDPEVRRKKIEAATQPEVLQKQKESKKMKYATDPEVRRKKIEAATQPEVLQKQKEYRKVKYATDPEVHKREIEAASERYSTQPEVLQKQKESKRKQYAQKKDQSKDSVEKIYDRELRKARETVSQLPILACTVCHRIRYREQVVHCDRKKYSSDNQIIQQCLTGEFIHICQENCELQNTDYHDLLKKEWICHTCHSTLKRNKMPVQAVINGLEVGEVPEELKALNALERHLIALVQAFIKIIPLPKGGQMGIRGQLVCVPADLQRTADSLPWTPDVEHLIRVKLKRKVEFKGHHLFMNVSQRKIMNALIKLKEINPLYKDVTLNENWISDIIQRGYQDIVTELRVPTLQESYEAFSKMEQGEVNPSDEIPLQEFSGYTQDEYESFIEDEIQTHLAYYTATQQEEPPSDSGLTENEDEVEVQYEHFNLTENTEPFAVCYEDEEEGTNLELQVSPSIPGDNNATSSTKHEQSDRNTISCQEQDMNTDARTQNPYDDIEHPFGMITLQPVDPSAAFSDKDVLSLAPSEGQKPIKQMESEAACFPCKFPCGKSTLLVQDECGDYVQDRMKDISIAKYCDSRVYSAKNVYDDDGEYLAFLQCVKERDQINSAASIALRKGRSTNVDGSKITAGSLVQGTKRKGNVLKNSQGYKYLHSIPGTPPYWEVGMHDLFAAFKQIGPPNIFVSFSAADRRWPEIAKAALIRSGQNPDLYSTLSWTEYCKLINKNPVAAVTMFERRVKAVAKLIKSDVQPLGGKVLDAFLRREMQDRGWPHIHGMFWIEGAPSMHESDEKHIEFVEKIISCSIPDQETDPELHEIVTSVQRHSKRHSRTCFKNKSNPEECRFGHPLPISDETFILRPGSPPDGQDERQWRKKAKAKIKSIQEFLTKTENLESWSVSHVLKKHDITKDTYREYLSALCKRDQVVLKRQPHEAFINFYNPKLIRFWNGNTDTQYIFNPHGVVKYVMSYITKAERELGDLIRKAQQESREGNMDAVQELKHLGDIYITHRSVSQMETIYRLTMLPLKEFSRETVFVPVDKSSYRFSRPLKEIAQMREDSEDIWATNVIDKYLARPEGIEFNDMCLADFVANYSAVTKSRTSEDEYSTMGGEEDDGQSRKSTYHHLLNNLGMIKKRQRPRIIKYYKVHIEKDRERYFHNLLRLYMPHRQWKLPPEFKTFEEWYSEGEIFISGKGSCTIRSIVDNNYQRYEQSADIIEQCEEEYRQGTIESHEDAWADLAKGAEEERVEQAEEMEEILHQHADHEKEIHYFQNMSDCPTMQPVTADNAQTAGTQISHKELLEMIRQMNKKQYDILMYVRDWCLKTIRGENPEPFFIHLSGSAGVGKSHATTTIAHLVRKMLQPLCEEPNLEVVFLSAFMGTAAFNVRGETLHSLFQLPLNMSLTYAPLHNEARATLEAKLKGIKLLVVDEISMIKPSMLVYIHGRLKDVMHEQSTDAPFGNVSLLGCGDYYQLPPVFSDMIFKTTLETDFLWNRFVLFTLTDIVRQRDDVNFSEFLNRIRTCKNGAKDLSASDKRFLKSREIKYNPTAPDYPRDAYHVFAFNEDVDNHNQTMLKMMCPERIVLNPLVSNTKVSKEIPSSKSDSNQSFYKQDLEIGVGARVMLKVNFDVKDGLANGATGTVVQFSRETLENGQPKVMYIKFDDPDVGKNLRLSTPMPAGIPKGSTPMLRHSSPNKRAGQVWTQFPVVLAWAGTIHKAQGKTLPKIVVSLANIRNAGQAYVGLSRVKSADRLFIIDLRFKAIFCDPEVEKLYSEMPQLKITRYPTQEQHSLSILHHNCEGLVTHIQHLERSLQNQYIDIICVSETHLRDNLNLTLPGYSFLGQKRQDCYNDTTHRPLKHSGGGGVGMFVRTSLLSSVTRVSSNISELEYIGLKSVKHGNHCTVFCIYRPPGLQVEYFIEQLELLLTALSQRESVILMGDINEHAPISAVKQFLTEKGFYQLITEATTIHANRHILDHCYVRNVDRPIKSGVIPMYYSFHEGIYLVSL